MRRRSLITYLLMLALLIRPAIPAMAESGTPVVPWEKLQEAINAAGSGSTIVLNAKNIDFVGPRGAGGELRIPAGKALTIDLDGITLDRNADQSSSQPTDGGNVIWVSSGATLTLKNSGDTTSYIKGGFASQGGGIYNEGTLNIEGDIRVADNKALSGGGIYNVGTLNMSGGSVIGNTATNDGGGIGIGGGAVNMSGGSVTGNGAAGEGGGISVVGGTLNVNGGSVSGNTAARDGGGINVAGGALNLYGGSVTSNTAQEAGGSIAVQGAQCAVNIKGSPVVKGGQAPMGGDIFLREGGVLNVTGALEIGEPMSVAVEDAAGTITSGYGANNEAGPEQYFVTDDEYSV